MLVSNGHCDSSIVFVNVIEDGKIAVKEKAFNVVIHSFIVVIISQVLSS